MCKCMYANTWKTLTENGNKGERLVCARGRENNRKRTEANLLPDSLQVERTRKSQWIIMELLSLDVAIVELLWVWVWPEIHNVHTDLFACIFFGLVHHSHSVLQYFLRLCPTRTRCVVHTHKCMLVCCVSLWTNEMNLSRVPLILSTFIVEKHFTCAATYFKREDRKINPLIHFASHSPFSLLSGMRAFHLLVCALRCVSFLFFFVFLVRTIITGLVQVSDEIDFLFSAQSHFVLPLSLCECHAFLYTTIPFRFIPFHSKWFLLTDIHTDIIHCIAQYVDVRRICIFSFRMLWTSVNSFVRILVWEMFYFIVFYHGLVIIQTTHISIPERAHIHTRNLYCTPYIA